jgi:hypothetical protein
MRTQKQKEIPEAQATQISRDESESLRNDLLLDQSDVIGGTEANAECVTVLGWVAVLGNTNITNV